MPKQHPKTLATRQDVELPSPKHTHDFSEDEITAIRSRLLGWYDVNKRDLPWRRFASESDLNIRAYAVWVSEIMLQQTQVATVIDYYNRWMKQWPTVSELAKANLERVNECWSGLGYYSRARRLHEGANKVMKDLNGQMPTTAATLQKQLPGVGRYTAGAVASIAFNEPTGVVDGNVIRVLSRLRTIGCDMSSNVAVEKFWELANLLVPENRPGDFNQALMEFGATVCTPKTPQCSTCVLRDSCQSFKEVEKMKNKSAERLVSGDIKVLINVDIEDCSLCFPSTETFDNRLGVCNYPLKAKKKAAKEETFVVGIVEGQNSEGASTFLIIQRPKSGLLAGLWEFPNQEIKTKEADTDLTELLRTEIGIEEVEEVKEIGEVTHKFSHCLHKYIVCHFICKSLTSCNGEEATNGKAIRWVSKEEFEASAVSTAMTKIFKLYESSVRRDAKDRKPAAKKRKRNEIDHSSKQMVLDAFFTSK